MSGNSGVGEDDELSAAALEGLLVALDDLEREELSMSLLGNERVAAEIERIREAVTTYLQAQFDNPDNRFLGALAMSTAQELKEQKKQLVKMAREDLTSSWMLTDKESA